MSRPTLAAGLALELRQLQKSFANLEVIKNLNLQLPQRQIYALIGPSGCGKSTLLNLISGLEKDYRGQILRRGRVAYMLQKDLLLPWRNIWQNVNLPRELHLPTCSVAEVDELFVLFGLDSFRQAYPHQLSGGMRQRANLLRTYTLRSELLLLDEPFGALDALSRQSLQHWFLQIQQQQARSILLITHDIREAMLLAEQIIVLSPRPCREVARFAVPGRRHSAALERQIFSHFASTTLSDP